MIPSEKIARNIKPNVNLTSSEPNVKPLPAFYESNTGTYISSWKMDWKERIRALFTGQVWVGIRAQYHPPIWIEAVPSRVFMPDGLKKPKKSGGGIDDKNS